MRLLLFRKRAKPNLKNLRYPVKITKTGHKILLKIGDYKPSSEEPDLDKEGRAAFIYRNAKFVEKIELEDPKALEIQFKNALPGEVLRIMV